MIPTLAELQTVVVEINPQTVSAYSRPPNRAWHKIFNVIDHVSASRLVSPLRAQEYLLGGDWEKQTVEFSETDHYKKLHNLFEHRLQYHNSLWYQEAIRAINTNGVFRYKHQQMHDIAAIQAFFQKKCLPLLNTMLASGYQQKPQDDVPYFMVGAAGQLYKSRKGRHRFAAALVTGVASGFPVRIETIHRTWWQQSVLARSEATVMERFSAALHELAARYQ